MATFKTCSSMQISSFKYPFPRAKQLSNELDGYQPNAPQTLPGYPRIRCDDYPQLLGFLERELISIDLERMAPRLWWMSKQDSASISPLHRQAVKKRSIIITEDPKLHLVWIQDRVFIKPLPKYLTSHAFWDKYLGERVESDIRRRRVRKAALGFLRTYYHLIQHESDFRMAQRENIQLIPPQITWKEFCDFSANFGSIRDSDVSVRYAYGEIRLTRLNFYSKILLRKWHFHRVEPQYGLYFARFYGIILFLLGILSVMLSAMQVELAVEQVDPLTPWSSFRRVSTGFSIASLIGLVCLVAGMASLLIYKIVKEWQYALRDRFRNVRELPQDLDIPKSHKETGFSCV